jgi:glutamyl-tRNA synthetase
VHSRCCLASSYERQRQTEFEETILEDLRLLDIKGDRVTHTSDYFDLLYDYAIQLIRSGNAYADDTEQLQVRSSISS